MKKIVSIVLVFVMLFGFSTSVFADSWTKNPEATTKGSIHQEILVATAIAETITALSGVPYSEALHIGEAIIGGVSALENDNLYYTVTYYWKASDDPQLPFYIKQEYKWYKTSKRKKCIATTEKYYYSTITQ